LQATAAVRVANGDAGLQTHLFEDRVMKVSRISIANCAMVGSRTIILYDSIMEDDSSLGDLSVLMKGEVLPAGTAGKAHPPGPPCAADRAPEEDCVQGRIFVGAK
jgi:hypothetical protein